MALSAGPLNALEPGFTDANFSDEGAVAAAEAAAHVSVGRTKTAAMLDAMEAAETEFEASHPSPPPKSPGLGGTRNPPGPGSPTRPAVSEDVRNKVRMRLAEAMALNPAFAGQDPAGAAVTCEQGIADATMSQGVYQGVASNALRLAASSPAVGDVAELLRIAMGAPRLPQVHDEAVLRDASGLQGYVLKPE